MAYQSMLLLALLFLTTTSLAHCYIINGTTIAAVQITGTVFCTVSGNPLPGVSSPGIAGINVGVRCNGGTTDIAQALTNSAWFFSVALNLLDGLLFDPSHCVVYIKLPVAGCALLPPTGSLQAVPVLIGVVQSVVGAVANLACGLLVHVVWWTWEREIMHATNNSCSACSSLLASRFPLFSINLWCLLLLK